MDRTAVKKQKSASAPKKKKTPKTKKTPKKKKTPVKKKKLKAAAEAPLPSAVRSLKDWLNIGEA